jgi:hypothetical protein
MLTALRITFAIAFAVGYGFCGFGAGGFGHGWTSATFIGLSGSVFLAFAVNNGLRPVPSRISAVIHLLLAIVSTIALYLGTQMEGKEYVKVAVKFVPEAVVGFLVGLVAFYVFPILALLRKRPIISSSIGLPPK